MLKVCPKLDDTGAGINYINNFIVDAFEIQMTCADVEKMEKMLTMTLNEHKAVKEVTVHAPMSHCDIEDNFDNKERLHFMYRLVDMCNKLSEKCNIRINMLYHCSNSFSYFEKKKQLWIFRRLIKLMRGKRTYLILENCILSNITSTNKDGCISVIKMLGSNKVKMCLDLAHAMGFSELSGVPVTELFKDKQLNEITRQVHFSQYKSIIGQPTIYDHSIPHKEIEDIKRDILLLKKLGLKDALLVVEVCEDDYNVRSNQIQEFKLLENEEIISIL